MKIRATFLALFAAFLLGACVSTNSAVLGEGSLGPRTDPREVRVFMYEDQVPGDYERIALVTARTDVHWHDETDLIEAMRKRAATLGADAIILDDLREPSTLEVVAEVLTDYEAPRRGRAVAIRLLD